MENLTQTDYETRIRAALDLMDDQQREMVVFGLNCAVEDIQMATAAGHGADGPALAKVAENMRLMPLSDIWTLLDAENVRPSYDYRFMAEFSPDAVAADCERMIDLLIESGPATTTVLIQRWKGRRGWREEWAQVAWTGRNRIERGKALENILREERQR